MTNGTEDAPAIWETKNAIKPDDSFTSNAVTLTEEEALKLSASIITLGDAIR